MLPWRHKMETYVILSGVKARMTRRTERSPWWGEGRDIHHHLDLWLSDHGSIVVFEALYYLLSSSFFNMLWALSLEISVFRHLFLLLHIRGTSWGKILSSSVCTVSWTVLRTPRYCVSFCIFVLPTVDLNFPPRSGVCTLGPSCWLWQHLTECWISSHHTCGWFANQQWFSLCIRLSWMPEFCSHWWAGLEK